MAVPLLGHVLSPLRSRGAGEQDFQPVGRLGDFTAGEPRRVSFPVTVQDGWERSTSTQAAWVVRSGEGVKVFSTTCPHLGCSVKWKGSEFECPCHDSAFERDGSYVHGPSRRGLDELPARLVGDELQVKWVEYEPGISESRPLGTA